MFILRNEPPLVVRKHQILIGRYFSDQCQIVQECDEHFSVHLIWASLILLR